MSKSRKSVAIIGGGPSALMAAAFLDTDKFDVTVYEKNKSLGRKFLVAGKGGFNLTHSEPIESMIGRYHPMLFLKNSLLNFSNKDLRNWFSQIGIETYIGSSNRVYQVDGIKPIEVLTAIVDFLKEKDVHLKFGYEWSNWKNDSIVFKNRIQIDPDFTIFALGGASWSVTGSNGNWIEIFKLNGYDVIPFQPANCAYEVNWSSDFINWNEGKPLKNISISCYGNSQLGEVVITQFGMEGNAIYALSNEIQKLLDTKGEATVLIDFKPTTELEVVLNKLNKSRHSKISDCLKRDLKLNNTQRGMLKTTLTREEFLNPKVLAKRIKGFPVTLIAAAPIDEAISTTGGIPLSAITDNFELKNRSNTFCIGEMLDWNSPTGGYLLQACFSLGVDLARKINQL
jgi:uncharacterized flavoprotein (TIGR03862 family)